MGDFIAKVSKYIVPAVSLASIAGAGYAASLAFKEKNADAPVRLDYLSEAFPYFSSLFGESYWINQILGQSCISPSWQDQFLCKIERFTKLFSDFRAIVASLEETIDKKIVIQKSSIDKVVHDIRLSGSNNVDNISASSFQNNQQNQFSTNFSNLVDIFNEFNAIHCELSRAIFAAATMIETMYVELHNIMTLLCEFKYICKAFNIYWTKYGMKLTYMGDENVSMVSGKKKKSPPPSSKSSSSSNNKNVSTEQEDISDNESIKKVNQLKIEVVRKLLYSGIDDDDNNKSSITSAGTNHSLSNNTSSNNNSNIKKYYISDENEVIASHVRWWTLMHCIFLPSMSSLSSHIGIIRSEGIGSWSDMTRIFDNIRESSNNGHNASGNIVSYDQISKSSSSIDIRFKSSFLKSNISSSITSVCTNMITNATSHGMLAFLNKPFHTLLPSPNSQCFIPCENIKTDVIDTVSIEITRRISWMFDMSLSSCEYIVNLSEYVENLFYNSLMMKIPQSYYNFVRNNVRDEQLKSIFGYYHLLLTNMISYSKFEDSPIITGVNKKSRSTITQSKRRIHKLSQLMKS